MAEIWKDVVGYEGLYQVSDKGQIKSLKRYRNNGNGKYLQKEKILKSYIGKNGYCIVDLYKNGKRKKCLLHRLVAEAFIYNPQNKPCINHIDCHKTNNNINNLEWCTYKENMQEAVKNKLVHTWCGTKFREKHPNYKFRGKWKTQKRVCQYDLSNNYIKTFNSATEVERLINICGSHIGECCRGVRKTAGGYIWKYREEKDNNG